MNKRTVFSMVLFIGICIVSAGAFAEEKKPEKALADEGEISFVNTGGNTEVTTLAAKNQLKYKFSDHFLATWKLGAVYGQNNKVTTAENYFTDLKVDYLFTERLYALADAGWLQNRFVGIDERLYTGLARVINS